MLMKHPREDGIGSPPHRAQFKCSRRSPAAYVCIASITHRYSVNARSTCVRLFRCVCSRHLVRHATPLPPRVHPRSLCREACLRVSQLHPHLHSSLTPSWPHSLIPTNNETRASPITLPQLPVNSLALAPKWQGGSATSPACAAAVSARISCRTWRTSSTPGSRW